MENVITSSVKTKKKGFMTILKTINCILTISFTWFLQEFSFLPHVPHKLNEKNKKKPLVMLKQYDAHPILKKHTHTHKIPINLQRYADYAANIIAFIEM